MTGKNRGRKKSAKKTHPPARVPASAAPTAVNTRFAFQEVYHGTIVHPNIVRGWEDVLPGAAERIMVMAEKQAAHRQVLEAKVVESNIKKSYWGIVLGTVIELANIGAGVLIAKLSNPWAGATSTVSITILFVIVAWMATKNRNKELQQKDKNSKLPNHSDR